MNHFQRQGWKNPANALQVGYEPTTGEYERIITDASGRLIVVNQAGPTPASPGSLSLKGSVLVGDTPTLLAPANEDRNYLVLVNAGSNICYIGDSSATAAPVGTTADGGIPIPPKGWITFNPGEDGLAIYGICDTGLSTTIVRREVTVA